MIMFAGVSRKRGCGELTMTVARLLNVQFVNDQLFLTHYGSFDNNSQVKI